METFKRYLPIAFAVITAFVLQAILLFADCEDTPPKIAVKFTKAYYALDPAMADLMCEKALTVNDLNVVEAYIQSMTREGKQRGLGKKYMRNLVYGIGTHTRTIDENTAEVSLHAKRRTSINPVFAYIGKFFFIGKTHKIDQTISLVKENGKWKVCGNIFSLSG